MDGSSQNNNNDGSTPDEEGYNMTITAISGCNITGATVGVPFPGEEGQYNCTGLLFNAWKTCE